MSDGDDQPFEVVFRLCPTGLALTGPGGLVYRSNPALAEMLGYSEDELVGQRLFDLTHPDDREASRELAERVLEGATPRETLEKRYLRRDGTPIRVRVTMLPLIDRDGTGRKLTQVEDLTDRDRREHELHRQAHHDPLTGLANRRGLAHALEQLVGGSGQHPSLHARQGLAWSIVYVDIDDFKLVNDTRGHPAGDALLRIIARRLQSALRAGDLVARVGGDEFVALLWIEHPDDAVHAGERIRTAVAEPVVLPGDEQPLVVDASIGVALPHRDEAPDAVIERADALMYADKRRRLVRQQRGIIAP